MSAPIATSAINTFLSTPSARRATWDVKEYIKYGKDFYPRPPRGGRRAACRPDRRTGGFLSTPSARRATHRTRQAVWKDIISIHALREEGDFRSMLNGMLQSISIHALREEGDGMLVTRSMSSLIFLSTPSARRATCLG